MMRKTWMGLVLIGALALAVLPAAYAEAALSGAAAPSVLRNYPSATPPCNTTLQACISGSGAGDVVNVLAGVYITNQLLITRAIVLQGAGPALTTLEAVGAQRVISVGTNIAAGVVILNLRVTGGLLTGGGQVGAGIASAPGTPLTLVNLDVLSNTNLINSGGGIFAGDALTMSSVFVIGNQDSGGAGGGLRATSSVLIIGGRFERNSSANPGGAMRVTGPLTMRGVTVISNTATAASNGGGVRADGGLLMDGGLVQNNAAGLDGGGVFATNALISGTQIISNSGNNGGGVVATGQLLVQAADFERNTARTGNGGALMAANAQIVSTTFGFNQAAGNGGALQLTAGAQPSLISGTNFVSNTAASGGALHILTTTLAVTNSTFMSNTASAGAGGAILNQGTFVLGGVDLFQGNQAQTNGGAVENSAGASLDATTGLDQSSDFCLGGSFFSSISYRGNRAISGDGGGLHNAGSFTVRGGQFFQNSAARGGGLFSSTDVALPFMFIEHNSATTFGGGVYVSGTLVVTSTEFEANSAGIGGGGTYVSGAQSSAFGFYVFNQSGVDGAGALVNGRLDDRCSHFSVNQAAHDGGGVLVSGTMVMTGTNFFQNTAANAGGGVRASGTITSDHVTYQNNRAGQGGGLFADSAVVLAASQFISNSALAGGGGAFAPSARVVGGSFERNAASATVGLGGGLLVSNSVSLSGTQFLTNSAFSGGGAFISGTLVMTGGQFITNTAGNGSAAGGAGGGLAVLGNASLNGTRFERNATLNFGTADGGGLFANASLTLSGTEFFSNTAGGGGGGALVAGSGLVKLFGGTFSANQANNCGGLQSQALEVHNTQFIANTAPNLGGGACAFTQATVDRARFENNHAASGGGLVVLNGQLLITNSLFIGNSANSDGAVVAITNFAVKSRIVNSLFARNQASAGAAALHQVNQAGGSTDIVHSTIVDRNLNSAPALVLNQGTFAITDTIIVSHSIAISRTSGGVSEDYNLYAANGVDLSFGVTSGGHSFEGTPGFVNPGGDDYHLAPGSGAIDRGIDAGIPFDIDGEPRPLGAGFDIGFDEAHGRIYLPVVVR